MLISNVIDFTRACFVEGTKERARIIALILYKMLSRREKLLVQPWQDRRYDDHRSKVKAARAAVDSAPPAPRPHVMLKAKKSRHERDRAARVLADNYRLLQRLTDVMRHNRLDNHWKKPPPNFHQKVGRYFDCSVERPRKSRDCRCLSHDCRCVSHDYPVKMPSLVGAKCYACEFHKMKNQKIYGSTFEDQLVLPSLNVY